MAFPGLSTSGMENKVIATGKLVHDDWCGWYLNETSSVDLVLDPEDLSRLDGVLKEGRWVQVIGTLVPPPYGYHYMAHRWIMCTAHVIPSQISVCVGDPVPSFSGTLTVDADEWVNLGDYDSSALGGTDVHGKKLYFYPPGTHRKWAAMNPSYLLEQRLTLSVSLEDHGDEPYGLLRANRVISKTAKEEIPTKEQKLLPSCKAIDGFRKQQKEKASKKGVRCPISPGLRKQIFMRDGYRCVHCGAMPSDGRHVFLEVDHVIPVSRGGTDDPGNLQTLCHVCNSGKSDQADPIKTVAAVA